MIPETPITPTPPSRCFVVAEVAQAHDGSLGFAHAFIDAAAVAGADAIKFQTHIADAESTPDEPWRVRFSQQDDSRYAYWQRMQFSEEQWHGLRRHAQERGLAFLSSPFSQEAVDLLTRVGVHAWKIASGEITNTPLLDRIAATGWPVWLSTGMSPLQEIDEAVALVRARHLPLTVLQCTSQYPCPPERLGLNVLTVFRERYGCGVGLSDHSGTIYAGLAAATVGIDVLEVHLTLSRRMFGPDVPVSLTPRELRQLVEGVRFIERATSHPVDKSVVEDEQTALRPLFMKSLVVRTDLAAGTRLEEAHLTAKKPGTGMSPDRLSEFVGRRLTRDVPRNHRLQPEDVE